MLIVYAKWNGTSIFHAFDLGNGVPVTRVITPQAIAPVKWR